ncbi:unnamed protein product [Closterium sp. NIES-64]|nr:unnamed protein product [Closterium sp. NIES-64]
MDSSHGDAVLLGDSMAALKLTQPSAAESSLESVDVVDLLPGPIWHIIFRHLLRPPLNSAQLHKQGNSSEGVSSQGADSSACPFVDLLTARVQHGENNKLYGPAWPLLCAAVASKRLLHYVLSFSELQPIMLASGSGHQLGAIALIRGSNLGSTPVKCQ